MYQLRNKGSILAQFRTLAASIVNTDSNVHLHFSGSQVSRAMSFRTDEEAPQFLWERTSYTRVSTSFLGLTWLNLRYEKEGTEGISTGNAWHQLTPRAPSHEPMHHGEEINSVAFYTASTNRLLIGSFFNALPMYARYQSTGLRSSLLTHPRPHYECYQSIDP